MKLLTHIIYNIYIYIFAISSQMPRPIILKLSGLLTGPLALFGGGEGGGGGKAECGFRARS